MKKQLALLLSAVFLTASLAACGSDQKEPSSAPEENHTAQNSDPSMEDAGDRLEDAVISGEEDLAEGGKDLVEEGKDLVDGAEDALTGDDPMPEGASYEQMVRNARVHDTDGDLRDHENAVTPGWD